MYCNVSLDKWSVKLLKLEPPQHLLQQDHFDIFATAAGNDNFKRANLVAILDHGFYVLGHRGVYILNAFNV